MGPSPGAIQSWLHAISHNKRSFINNFIQHCWKSYKNIICNGAACSQKLWYNRGNCLMTLLTDWDSHGQKLCPEPVPSWVLKGAKANLLTRTEQNCEVQDDSSITDLQLFHSAVDELIKGLRTRCCVRFWCKSLDMSRWCTFKERFRYFHSVGTKAALGNRLPNKLDTAKQLPTTSVHTNWLEEKK